MKAKQKIMMLTSFLVLSVAICSFTNSQAAIPSWGQNDTFTWGMQTMSYLELEEVGSGKLIYDVFIQNDVTYNITAIDTFLKTYNCNVSGYGYNSHFTDIEYGAQEFKNNYLVTANCLDVDYKWDYVNNQARLNRFVFALPMQLLIEPDWEMLNKGFQDAFNSSEIVELLADPYTSDLYTWTLGDFFNDISVKIMGRNTLEKGFERFKASNNKWTFEFDASGTIHSRYNNGTHMIFVPYDQYKITCELEYDVGGVLNFYKNRLEYSITYPKDPVESNKVVSENKIALGGINKVAKFNISTIVAIGGFITLAATIMLVRKRRE